MSDHETLGERLRNHGVTRRGFLKFCAATASLMAVPPALIPRIAEALEQARRPSVIWLSFQECTGCTESLTRSHDPTVEGLIFDYVSLDYHETLLAASGHGAEAALHDAMEQNKGQYLLLVDGSIPLGLEGAYSVIGGQSNLATFKRLAEHAAAVVAIGTCSAFGGLPMARPNPTGAVSVQDVINATPALRGKPVINVPGCPPIPTVITGVLAYYLTFGIPELDLHNRPKIFFGETIHDRCYRRPFYEAGKFAKTFDDAGAREGWCLFNLGCKGPVTYNACATLKWNEGTSFPIQSGHGCLGCSEPAFWDKGSFYTSLSQGTERPSLAGAAAAGAVVGAAVAWHARGVQEAARQPVPPA